MIITYNLTQTPILPKTAGIYIFTCIPTQKVYIGSAKDIRRRFQKHIRELNRNKHHSKYFQNSWNKYGYENFTFGIIEYCKNSDLVKHEQQHLDSYKAYHADFGFNQCSVAYSCIGTIRTLEQKIKMSAAMTGIKHGPFTKESKQNMSIAGKNKIFTINHKSNLSKSISKEWKVTNPYGCIIHVTDLKGFCKTNNISYTYLLRQSYKNKPIKSGWMATCIDHGNRPQKFNKPLQQLNPTS